MSASIGVSWIVLFWIMFGLGFPFRRVSNMSRFSSDLLSSPYDDLMEGSMRCDICARASLLTYLMNLDGEAKIALRTVI
jgi:hypothetical protein